MSEVIDVIVSKEYRLLKFMKELEVPTGSDRRILHSQNELSQTFGVSIATVNKMITALCEIGCIEKFKQKSGYRITIIGEKIIQQIESIDNITGGKTHAN